MCNKEITKASDELTHLLGKLEDIEKAGRCPIHGPYIAKEIHINGRLVCPIRCPQCEKEAKEKEEHSELRQWRDATSGIPAHLRHCQLEDFIPRTENEVMAKEALERYTGKNANFPGILLYGASSVGKTHLLCAALNTVPLSRSIHYVELTSLLGTLRSSGWAEGERKQREVLNTLSSVAILAIDGIGEDSLNDKEVGFLRSLLDIRGSEEKPTMAASSVPPNYLESILGTPLANRLKSFLGCYLDGPSRRKAPNIEDFLA